jgi:hypothetical protein
VPVHVDEHVVDHVLSFIFAAQNASRDPAHQRSIPVVEAGESTSIAARDCANKCYIVTTLRDRTARLHSRRERRRFAIR